MKPGLTSYLYSVLKESENPVLPFRDENFIILSNDELKNGLLEIDATHPLCSLLSATEFKKLFEAVPTKSEESISVPCVVSYKTLKTEFFLQSRLKNELPELTGVFYFSFEAEFCRKDAIFSVQFHFDNTKLPWFARSCMEPNYLDCKAYVAKVADVDTYAKNTTEQRAQIQKWFEYVEYCETFFQKTGNTALEYEKHCYVFRYDIQQDKINSGLSTLYQKLLESEGTHPLYDTIVSMERTSAEKLLPKSEKGFSTHCGQMNGKFSLAPSQKDAVLHMNTLQDGEVLAVSGPPGTGKTTLLQSLVADMVVQYALDDTRKAPPIIVASSANNQAVTNIIDSFSQITPIGISNLEMRWVDGVKSFATYMPSTTKLKEAVEKGYQYSSYEREFLTLVEKDTNKSKKKMYSCAKRYFEKSFFSLEAIRLALKNELHTIHDLQNEFLSVICRAADNPNTRNYKNAVLTLKEKELEYTQCKTRLKEWQQIYNSIDKKTKVFSFLPKCRKKITAKLQAELLPEEVDFLGSDLNFTAIEEKYGARISTCAIEISNLKKHIVSLEALESDLLNIVIKLQEHHCELPILSENKLLPFSLSEADAFLDTHVRYVAFWLAVHINECRFLEGDFKLTEKQKKATFKNVMERFYQRMALLSPCFIMTTFKMPSNFATYEGSYLFDYIDLLIFDEAGQCSPEIAAANFSLAKKAVVVGDECQIPPVYNTDLTMDITLALQNDVLNDAGNWTQLAESGLSCSAGSVMQMAKNACKYQTNEHLRGLFLSEHRRCYDEIIDYCNKLVYDGLLCPMRNQDENQHHKTRPLDAHCFPMMGYFDVSSSKSRNVGSSRTNSQEASTIANWLKVHYAQLIEAYPDDDPKSVIAIITPFAAQAHFIRNQLKEVLGKDSNNISVGTVHTFQGAERKVILFSPVYSANERGAFIENNKNLLNVAVSRAKDAFWVFGDMKFMMNKSPQSAIGLLYNHIANFPLEE